MYSWQRLVGCSLLAVAVAGGQPDWRAGLSSPSAKARTRAARTLGEMPGGDAYLDLLAPLLRDSDEQVRVAAVTAILKMRVVDALPLLVDAAGDHSPAVQTIAVDGLVDFYIPGYFKFGSRLTPAGLGGALKNRFSKPSPLILPAYIDVSPSAIKAIGDVVRTGKSDGARANAARAIGILRGQSQIDALVGGVRSRSEDLILECVLAIKKLQDMSVGPELVFLLRDLEPVLLEAVVQTVGQLRTIEAVPGLVRIVEEGRKANIRTQALVSLAKIPNSGQRELFISYLRHKDDSMRAAAAEGIGRIGTAADLELIDQLAAKERSLRARLSMAFASVMLGDHVRLARLIEGLNSKVHRLEARPLIVELARDPTVLSKLYVPLATGTPPQRRHLAVVLARSGTSESVPYLESLMNDSNNQVASAAIESLRILRARL